MIWMSDVLNHNATIANPLVLLKIWPYLQRALHMFIGSVRSSNTPTFSKAVLGSVITRLTSSKVAKIL